MLLQQEVFTVINSVDAGVEYTVACHDSLDAGSSSVNSSSSMRSTVRGLFDRLHWVLKLLTLDSPADVRRYKIPKEHLEESQVRDVLSRRTDLPRDAIARVKIHLF